jgi:hypothetical protein
MVNPYAAELAEKVHKSRLIGYHLFAGLSFIGSNLRRTANWNR